MKADVDYFLKISGIQGESQDRTHRDEIEVRSWSWGLPGQPRPVPEALEVRRVSGLPPRTGQAEPPNLMPLPLPMLVMRNSS